MKNTKYRHIDVNQRKLFAFGVVLILLVFLVGYFYFVSRKFTSDGLNNNTVYLQDSKLYVFDDVYTIKQYPDRILMHYPYLLVVQADKALTTVYNLENKKKEKEVKEILLDYYQGNIVYNKKQSFYNNINLEKYCDSAFIKSTKEVLCIAKSNPDSYNNQLYSIQTSDPTRWKQIYKSENILTTVSVINKQIYIGEINFNTKQNYISVNNVHIPVDSGVNVIYEIQQKPYYATIYNGANNNKPSYYQINASDTLIQGERVLLYKE